MKPRFLLLIVAAAISASCGRISTPSIPGFISHTVSPAPPDFTDISIKCQGQRVPVIMFHDIIKVRDRKSQWFDCSESEFKDLMQQIQDEGIVPISLDQLYGHLTKGDQIPERSVVLTFDDNYQGFYDQAYPILKSLNYPAAMFVHTGFVGNKTGLHPKMDWPTLKLLTHDPLITIGSHTITHPDDITKLDSLAQTKELQESKATLESQLGKPCPYFAYPNGMNDDVVQQLVKSSGYKMAFSIHNGLAEESPNIYSIDRYVHTRFKNALEDMDKAARGGAILYRGALQAAPVKFTEGEYAGVELALVTGGMPVSLMSQTREGVLDFIRRTPGTVAGINGGFFAMAAVASTDNQMVGPLKTGEMSVIVPDESKERWGKLRDRPLVMWGPTGFAIASYQPESMRADAVFNDLMPDMTDLFMAGVVLLHGGVARSRDDMDLFAAKDIQDPRRRSFLGLMPDGEIVLGASKGSASSEKLAEAAAAAGVSEAVLLDSGFSTSLVYGQSIKASGHSTATQPSRPVPHAILIRGQLDAATASLGAPDINPPAAEPAPRHHRRRRR